MQRALRYGALPAAVVTSSTTVMYITDRTTAVPMIHDAKEKYYVRVLLLLRPYSYDGVYHTPGDNVGD